MTRETATASRNAARIFAAGLLALSVTAALPFARVRAQDKPDPVVAKVGAEVIHLSDVDAAVQTLPPQARQMPRDQLLPKVVEQMVDSRILAEEARKQGLEKDPAVQRTLHEAQERTLVSTLLEREVGPNITDAAVKARYEKETRSQPPVPEVHARHILVDDEATAKKIIAELKKGGDFAALSKQYSKDTAAVEQGGDLGYFKATDMVPEFSAVAFALKDNEISPTPVHTQFGWHVIQTLDHRTAPPPSFEQAKDRLRQQMINEEVQKVLAKARADVTVERFDLADVIRTADKATPAPANLAPGYVGVPSDIVCTLEGTAFLSDIGASGEVKSTNGSVKSVSCSMFGNAGQKKKLPLASSTITGGMLPTKDFGALQIITGNNLNSNGVYIAIGGDKVDALRAFLKK